MSEFSPFRSLSGPAGPNAKLACRFVILPAGKLNAREWPPSGDLNLWRLVFRSRGGRLLARRRAGIWPAGRPDLRDVFALIWAPFSFRSPFLRALVGAFLAGAGAAPRPPHDNLELGPAGREAPRCREGVGPKAVHKRFGRRIGCEFACELAAGAEARMGRRLGGKLSNHMLGLGGAIHFIIRVGQPGACSAWPP